MCIAIITTEHPHYPFILLNNRDEYLHRPTQELTWWPEPHEHVLGGYDLHRPVHGTWLGCTKDGRIAVLTNFKEDDESLVIGALSRGLIPNAWLKPDPNAKETPEQFAQRMIEKEGIKGVGGFSLVYGFMQDVVKGGTNGLHLISNRTADAMGIVHLAGEAGETRALSNAAYNDRSWPKVINGEKWTQEAISKSVEVNETREQLVERLLDVLSRDTMPRQKENEEWDMYINQLRHSIFIPSCGKDELEQQKMPAHEIGDVVKHKALHATDGVYGTQKSIIIMVDKEGKVYYLERTLYDRDAKPIEKGKGDRAYEFQIEGW